MNTNGSNILVQNKNIVLIALAVAFILLLILLAMWFTGDVTWTLFDFAAAGTMLFGTGFVYELITRKAGTIAYRAAIGVALATALSILWINLAVGIVGSEDNAINWVYVGVLIVLMAGTLIARLRPQGMTHVLFITALAHVLATVIALIAENGLNVREVLKISALNGFFVVLWAGSALLFRHANASQKPAA